MQWSGPCFPALLTALRNLVPQAPVIVSAENGSEARLHVCGEQHVHCFLGVMTPYAFVLLALARAYATALLLQNDGLTFDRALRMVWDVAAPAMGPLGRHVEAEFFATPNPVDHRLH